MTLQQVPNRWIVALMCLLLLPLLLALGGCSEQETALVEPDKSIQFRQLTGAAVSVYRIDDLNRRTTCYVTAPGGISCLPSTIYEEDVYP